MESGDIIKSGCIIDAELGEVIAGTKSGRKSNDSVTIYKSLGLAVQDLAAANLVSDLSRPLEDDNPIKHINRKDININEDKISTSTDDKCVETSCKADHIIFTCKTTLYLSLSCTTCEITTTSLKDGIVCSSLCFLYNSTNGKLVAIIDDWDCHASKEAKIKIISTFKS